MPSMGQNTDDSRLESGPPQAGAKVGPRQVDRAIAALAARQHGVVAGRQLAALGVAQRAVSHRVAAGRLHRVHHGVYCVGHTLLTPRGRWMAAVLACGPHAVLSHASAAALWEIRFSASASTDVTIPRTGRRSRGRIRIHRPRTLGPDEVTEHRGIPVTTPARTILDMAALLQQAHLERLLDQAEIRELTDYPALDAMAKAHAGHRGASKLRAALQRHDAGTELTKSDLEILFRQICKDHGLPEPRVNQRVAGKEVDFLFETSGLIVEADSWRYHKTRRAFESDRARDAITAQAGYRTLRFTDRQLTDDPGAVAAAVAALLGARSVGAVGTSPRS